MSSDDWCSPPVIRDGLERLGGVDADPCTNARSIIKSVVRYTAGGLHLPWRPPRFRRRKRWRVYENPPYSRLLPWTAKGISELMGFEGDRPTELIRLVPVATSTAWWRCAMLLEPPPTMHLDDVRAQIDPPLVLFTSRLPFIDEEGMCKEVARFDPALICYLERRDRRRRVREVIEAFAGITSMVIDMADLGRGKR